MREFFQYMLPIRYWFHRRHCQDYCLSLKQYKALMLGCKYTVWRALTNYRFT